MWLGPIQDSAFAERCLKSIEGQEGDYATWKRMHGMLSLAKEVSAAFGTQQVELTARNWLIPSTSPATRFPATSRRLLRPRTPPCKSHKRMSLSGLIIQIRAAQCGIPGLALACPRRVAQDQRADRVCTRHHAGVHQGQPGQDG